MNPTGQKSPHLLWPALVAGLCITFALFTPTAFTQQSGGPYTMRPSVIPAGGGASSNGARTVEGSSGQNVVQTSTNTPSKIVSGFWPNASACPAALAPVAEFFPLSGGTGGFNVIAPSFCTWTALVSDSWITLTSANTGGGNDVITFETRENFTGSARQAVISIAGFNHVVVQDAGIGEDCGYTISPTFRGFGSSGGTGSISVGSDSRCAWSAITAQSWITITSINVGIGNGSISYSVGANTGPSRNGTIVIAGKIFAIKQKGS